MPPIGNAAGESHLLHFIRDQYRVRGVVHVGANSGQEIGWYLEQGCRPVLCFEPHPDAVERARQQWSGSSDISYVQCALGAESATLTFYVPADGDDQKTSRYLAIPTEDHDWTEQSVGGAMEIPVVRFDDWVNQNRVSLAPYNALVVDVQGMEMEVLEGCGAYLEYFDFLCVELSAAPLYVGELPAEEVVRFLDRRGFRQVTPIEQHEDVLFIRNSVPLSYSNRV
jgi:FkbM family methyltransferase